MSVLLAAQKMQADMAGLTGPLLGSRPTAAPTSATEALSNLIHGESGSLGFLWGDLTPIPITDPLRRPDNSGPFGGAGHPDALGGRTFAPGRPLPVNLPAPVGLSFA